MFCGKGSQILQSLQGSYLLGFTDGNAPSPANILAMNYAAQTWCPAVRLTEGLTFSESVVGYMRTGALRFDFPLKVARQVAMGTPSALKRIVEVAYMV